MSGKRQNWQYRNFTYNNNRTLREAVRGNGSNELSYVITRSDDQDNGTLTVHSWVTITDPSAPGATKVWFFYNGIGTSVWNAGISGATNRVNGHCYDGNGNLLASYGCNGSPMYTYDVQNRLTGGATTGFSVYLYSAQNKRQAMFDQSGNETVYFYGVRGEKLTTFTLFASQTPPMVNNVYFGGRLVERNNALVWTDRLGSVKNSAAVYLPYGEELAPTANTGTEKFATYTRDATTGLDYADQRYYASTFGRFMSGPVYCE